MKIIKEFKRNWELHDYCPVCKNKSIAGCKCFMSDRICENRHHWYICPEHGTTNIGKSDHSKPTNICHCNSTAYERTEI